MKSDDLFAKITEQLIADIEAGADEWQMPWHRIAEAGIPRSVDKRPYRGMNAYWLSMVAFESGWTSGVWGTYKAWQRHDAQVRKGEKGTPVVLWKPSKKVVHDDDTGEDSEKDFLFATVYYVFAAEQVDGADEFLNRPEVKLDAPERLQAAEAYFNGYDVRTVEGGNRASYDRSADEIHLPAFEQFDNPAHYYSTRAHESVHSTGHESRLNRTFGKRFGDEAYAAEELVAEMGAAMWSAQAGLSNATRKDHAAYLSHWLKVLRTDSKALLTITSKSQAAVDYLNEHTTDPFVSV